MPLTASEKQRRYRKKLEVENPEKLTELKKKDCERSLQYYRNKMSSWNEEQKEEQRQKRREDRRTATLTMPVTPAEKQRIYRQKLKIEAPEKFEAMKKKDKERSRRYYYRNKISNPTEEQRQELRLKWRENKRKATRERQLSTSTINDCISQDNDDSINEENNSSTSNHQSRVESQLRQENKILKENLEKMSRGFKTLQNKLRRQQNIIDQMNEDMMRLKRQQIEIEIDPIPCNIEDFPNDTISDVGTPEQDPMKIKLEHEILGI